VLHPVVAGSLALVYLTDGRFSLPKNPAVLDVTVLSQAALGLAEVERSSPTEPVPMESAVTLAVTHGSLSSPDTLDLEMPGVAPQENTGDVLPASHSAQESMPVSMRRGGS
jgi:hypothetical protein